MDLYSFVSPPKSESSTPEVGGTLSRTSVQIVEGAAQVPQQALQFRLMLFRRSSDETRQVANRLGEVGSGVNNQIPQRADALAIRETRRR